MHLPRSNIYEDIKDNSDKIWRFDKYDMIMEFKHKPALPIPLSIFSNIPRIFIHLCRDGTKRPIGADSKGELHYIIIMLTCWRVLQTKQNGNVYCRCWTDWQGNWPRKFGTKGFCVRDSPLFLPTKCRSRSKSSAMILPLRQQLKTKQTCKAVLSKVHGLSRAYFSLAPIVWDSIR